eukprot:jgi/Botrbrau1/14901/Bobra.0018s0006.1
MMAVKRKGKKSTPVSPLKRKKFWKVWKRKVLKSMIFWKSPKRNCIWPHRPNRPHPKRNPNPLL